MWTSCGPELDTILDKPDITVRSVLEFPMIRVAFMTEHGKLVDFLKANLSDLTLTALGATDCESREIVSTAYYCLTTQTPRFTSFLTTDRSYVAGLVDFLSRTETPTKYNLIAISGLLRSIVDKSNGFVFINVPDKPKLFQDLLRHISEPSVLNCIVEIAENKGQPVIQFFEAAAATTQLLDRIKSATDADQKTKLLFLLKTVCQACLMSQRLIEPILDLQNCEFIYQLMMEDENTWARQYAAALLVVLIKAKVEDETRCEDLIIAFAGWLETKTRALVERICTGDEYDPTKSSMVAMIVQLNMDERPVPECVGNLCKYLLDMTFKFEGNTILHNDFLAIFQTSWREIELIKRCNLLHRIPEAFAFYRSNHAVYWNILYSVTELIAPEVRAGKMGNVPLGWIKFVEETWKPMDKVISGKYGGDLPTMFDEYEYEEEEEEEEEEDENQ